MKAQTHTQKQNESFRVISQRSAWKNRRKTAKQKAADTDTDTDTEADTDTNTEKESVMTQSSE
jgi:hypothetical protein